MGLKAKLIIGVLAVLLIIAGASLIYSWYKPQSAPVTSQSTYVPAPQIKEVTKIKTVTVPGPERIVTVEKQVIVDKLKLPDAVKTAPEKQIVATAEIQPYEGITNAVAVLDTKTGVSEIIAKQEPLPLLGFLNKKEAYVRAGYSTDLETQITVGARWQFARIGAIKIGAYGEASNRSGGEAVAGVEVSY